MFQRVKSELSGPLNLLARMTAQSHVYVALALNYQTCVSYALFTPTSFSAECRECVVSVC